MVRPDQVSLGVLVNAVPRDVVDEAVAVCGVREKRSDGKLPAHVITYLTLALCLFPDDDYTEVATKVTGSLDRWGCWNAAWTVPTASAITQARKRLGRQVFAELFERCCGPVAGKAGPTAEVAALGTARGAFLRRWRLLAIDGFEIDLPDSKENAAEFGYAGSGDNRSAFPKARVVALAECGTHAFVAAEVDAYCVGEKTLAQRLYPRLRADELLTADRGFYSWQAWDTAAATGAALLWRAPTQLDLPVVRVLRRRHLPHRADQAVDPGPAPGAAAGRRPRRRATSPTSTPSPTPSTSAGCRSSTWPGSSSTTCPTGSATAPAS